jgi:hypothetical protein
MLADLRYAVWALVASPGFTLAAVLTLALRIGTNTSIFTVVDGVRIALLPLSRVVRAYVFGVSAADPASLAVAGAS